MPTTSRSLGVRAAISATLLSSVVVSPMKAERDLAYSISVRPPCDRVHNPFAPVAQRNNVGLGARTIKQQMPMRPDRFKIHQIHHTASPQIHQS
ncbi:hypothetical protein [Streptomyces sp. NPDC056669]|uniref:hypothetical protein n=1 Tax=unclassified Streptomyces TaxID=2593676 RepID=UPI0036AC696D